MSILTIVGIVVAIIVVAILLVLLGVYLTVVGGVNYVASGQLTKDLTEPKPIKKGWFK
jgi:predicted membrane protein